MTGLRLQDTFFIFLLVDLVRFNCAPIRGLNASAVFGVELTTEGIEPYHDCCTYLRMHHLSLTRSPLVPYLMRAPVLGQVWVLRMPR